MGYVRAWNVGLDDRKSGGWSIEAHLQTRSSVSTKHSILCAHPNGMNVFCSCNIPMDPNTCHNPHACTYARMHARTHARTRTHTVRATAPGDSPCPPPHSPFSLRVLGPCTSEHAPTPCLWQRFFLANTDSVALKTTPQRLAQKKTTERALSFA